MDAIEGSGTSGKNQVHVGASGCEQMQVDATGTKKKYIQINDRKQSRSRNLLLEI